MQRKRFIRLVKMNEHNLITEYDFNCEISLKYIFDRVIFKEHVFMYWGLCR